MTLGTETIKRKFNRYRNMDFIYLFIFWRGFCYRACALARERDRDTEIEKSLPKGDGHTAIPSPLFSSWDLGHARTCAWHEFKPLCLGRELWSTTWESSDVAVMPSASP